MAVVLPPLPPPMTNVSREMTTYLAQLSNWAHKSLARQIPRDEAVPGLFLISPSNKVYQLTVGDTGTLTTTLVVPGKTSP
jgi:hypothetical protein